MLIESVKADNAVAKTEHAINHIDGRAVEHMLDKNEGLKCLGHMAKTDNANVMLYG